MENELENNKKLSEEEKREYEKVIAKVDDYSAEELGRKLKEYKVKAVETGNELSDPFPFNLMFQTQIGPTGNQLGYLRPETAQGIFVNFSKLLQFNRDQMPFAGATIGPAFRNEIAPRSGLLRVREFTLAEIEHFVDPNDKSHPKFASLSHLLLPLYPRKQQEESQNVVLMPVGEAVKRGLINNETLGYFLGRIALFLLNCGVKEGHYRFRQHLQNEMAHYASDCWDAELLTSYGWVECVGCADRACYDLSKHQQATNSKLSFFKPFPSPLTRSSIRAEVNKAALGKSFRKEAPLLIEHLSHLSPLQITPLQEKLDSEGAFQVEVEGNKYRVTKEMVQFVPFSEKVSGETIIPSVIEPSFGVGRILYSILEQSFYVRKEDAQKNVLSLPPLVAPFKCALLPLQSDSKFDALLSQISKSLKTRNISHTRDESGVAIGRKYARIDELGVPFAVTIDYESLEDKQVTLRERDSTKQVRVPIEQLPSLLLSLIDGSSSWEDLLSSLSLNQTQN